MSQVLTNPEAAFDAATRWEGLGGGHAARHCALAALVEIGHYSEAAQGLEKLAQEVRADAGFKVQILVQSARAWIAAGDAPHAAAVTDAALELVPNAMAARLVRGRARALQGQFWNAIDDFNEVLSANPALAEALVMRGAAYRQLDALDLSLEDLNRGLTLEPDHPEGLLERGIVYRLQDHKAEARADWRRLIELYPKSEAARAARNNLHRLDSGVDNQPVR